MTRSQLSCPGGGTRSGVVVTVCLALWLLLSTSCSRNSSDQAKNRRGAAGPAPVTVAVATNMDVPVEIQCIGTVQAYSLVSIRSQITGKIQEVHFREGQEVAAGDLLFTIDPRPFEAALNQAQANVKRDEAQLVNARLNFERTSNLFVSKIASQSDYDTAEATYQSAQGTVLADNAAVTNAEVNLDYTGIRAPIAGRTGSLTVKEGNVVKAPDDILVTLAQVHPIYVGFSVPERNLQAIRLRAAEAPLVVRAFAPSATNDVAQGELTFVNNTVDTNTGTILLKGTFQNENNVLWPGQFVQVSLVLSNLPNATVVPTQAVQTGQNGEFLFVVKPDNTVEARPVVTGITFDGVRVITSGVKVGETIVTDGQLRLTPGAVVVVKTNGGGGK